ncbi:sodium bicarbonate transporter-like protein 11 [Anneissia japonica]|uniref:sodium bicarbonate transporter-like protein 11 n=1 Tax=Anneissia japonica TaxID=1529436 RepID=UPI00142586F6|nr:sodium bicarbonate transporter-like protein 11 [Anneissia japonica]
MNSKVSNGLSPTVSFSFDEVEKLNPTDDCETVCLPMTSLEAAKAIEADSNGNTGNGTSNGKHPTLDYDRIHCQIDSTDTDNEEVTLMYCQHERLSMKDFQTEVRAAQDIETFAKQATLILDMNETSMEHIFVKLLKKILNGREGTDDIVKEAKSALFTQDSVHKLSKTIQSTSVTEGGGMDYDQSWICALCSLPSLQRRHIGIARLKHAANMGTNSQEIHFVILILSPLKEKGTKNALETGRTFSTIFADIDYRQQLLDVKTEDEFHQVLLASCKDLRNIHRIPSRSRLRSTTSFDEPDNFPNWYVGRGLRSDITRRLPYYWSDFKDGFVGHKTLQKMIAATIFLYFACILPSIAFGVLNDKNTKGAIDVQKVIFAQMFGGIVFAFLGGQPLIVLLTTAPLTLYIKVIYSICEDLELNFFAMYACVGLWNAFFLVVYSVVDASLLIKWSTRSTEEIFSLFISVAFSVDAIKDLAGNFDKYYNSECDIINKTLEYTHSHALEDTTYCNREVSLLYVILMFGTLWVGIMLYNSTKSPLLDASKREMLTDYALPVSVLFMSFIGSYVFRDIKVEALPYHDSQLFVLAPLETLPIGAWFGAMGLGFCLSLLFFMDQNISSAMVNNPANKLKKGSAYHLDLFVVALLNAMLSIFGLPWVHAALPHSPLHVKALADVEERVDQGHVYNIIVRVRETRVTSLFSHILIGLSLFMLPNPLQYIPKPVLYGLFLYLAFTALDGNQMFERMKLLITEQAAYPPNHYVRRVPQRKMHTFTFVQLIQLIVLCSFGFVPYPYLKMTFPVLILILLPIRHKLVPKIIDPKYIAALDRSH